VKTRDLARIGIPPACAELAKQLLQRAQREHRGGMLAVLAEMERVAKGPGAFREHHFWRPLAAALEEQATAWRGYVPRETEAPYRIFGEGLEPTALQQLRNACRLPVSVAAALMPDAHQGYGLPIGGVLATREAIIPYAVGVDIACRMRMSVLDLGPEALSTDQERLARALESETRFGVGAEFKHRRQHAVMDADWGVTRITSQVKDRAWAQLGTSGSGNHFVEYGLLRVLDGSVGLPVGEYLALLSHSGSRGAGGLVAQHYSKVARELHKELPRELSHLAWLDLANQAGQEYWAAMSLMGRYAAANHELIHAHVVRALGATVRLAIENHHNFAWREKQVLPDGTEAELIVHRKGATPAGAGVLGIIPGSMGTPGYVVRGRGAAAGLLSASHGAGRRMSRTKAKQTFSWEAAQRFLRERKVTLLSAGLDEVPMAYKDIEEVMAAQRELVEPLARFEPRLVKMAPGSEPAED
jgi:tRNA-splicing ligase RtcB